MEISIKGLKDGISPSNRDNDPPLPIQKGTGEMRSNMVKPIMTRVLAHIG